MAKITELLLVPHTHHDIGYTHVPDVCMRMHEQAIYEAMGLDAAYTKGIIERHKQK